MPASRCTPAPRRAAELSSSWSKIGQAASHDNRYVAGHATQEHPTTTVTVTRTINTSPTTVFLAATDISSFPDANPDVLGIEFLTKRHYGVGTRFRETRSINGKELVTELEVTEYDAGCMRLRMVADSQGTV